ncbi:MAG: AAA family ATPase [Candidatus Saccharimonadales bacterium]
MKLIGLSGTNGAGKDLVGELLAERHGYLFVSVTDLLRDECRKRGLPVERENLRLISGEWRRDGGLGALVDKAVALYKASEGQYKGLVMASMRNPGEADRIHELGGSMVWVDADPIIRYDRVYSRMRSQEDNKTYEEFLADSEVEMHGNPNDPTSLNMSAVKERCDLTILNEGDDIEAFAKELVPVLQPLGLL